MTDVLSGMPAGKIEVVVEHGGEACSPNCGKTCPGINTRRTRWRHLDTCHFGTHHIAEVPRASCGAHGLVQVSAPWAEAGSRFHALFESMALDWLKQANFAAVARRLV